MLRHALASFYPRGARRAGAWPCRSSHRPRQPRGASAAPATRRDELHDLPARRADRHRAGHGRADAPTAGPSPAPAASARRSTVDRAAPAGALRRRLEAARADARRHAARAAADAAHHRHGHDGQQPDSTSAGQPTREDRHDRRRPRCCCCRTRSSARTKRSPHGCGRRPPGTTIPVYRRAAGDRSTVRVGEIVTEQIQTVDARDHRAADARHAQCCRARRRSTSRSGATRPAGCCASAFRRRSSRSCARTSRRCRRAA